MSNTPELAKPQPVVPEPESKGEAPYGQVSLLAMGALILGAIFATILVVGFIISFFRHEPLLLPMFIFVLPMAGLLMGWMALVQIQSSEGTTTGLGLARWAIYVSLLSGLLYGAYFSATSLAIRRQGDAYARQSLELIKQGKLEEAFWLSIPPPRSAYGPSSKKSLETRFNSGPDFNKEDTFSGFSQQDYVRVMKNSSGIVEIGPAVVSSCAVERGGYVLALTFPIRTSYGEFPLLVTAFGADLRNEKASGRQWRIILPATHTLNKNKDTFVPGPKMLELQPFMQNGGILAQEWMDALRDGKAGQTGVPIKLADDFYCPNDADKETILKEAKNLLTPEGAGMLPPPKGIVRGRAPMPLVQETDDKGSLTLRYDYQLLMDRKKWEKEPLIMECQAIVDVKDKPGVPGGKIYQVKSLEILRARTLPPASKQQQRSLPPG